MKQEKLTVQQFRELAEKQNAARPKAIVNQPLGKSFNALNLFRTLAKKSPVAKLTFEQLAQAQSEVASLLKGKRVRGAKYNNEKIGGYDSKKEYYRAQQLKIMQRTGIISDLREQVPFLLTPSQRNCDGVAERATRYIADFVYIDNATGKTVVEDTKGFKTPEYIIKRKLMLMVHGITIKEI